MAETNFGVNVKDLCRLCAKNDHFAKDLMDDSNKNVLHLVLEFFRLAIDKEDNMSTKICLNCEEKMVSFHLFILDCNKAQDTLRKLAAETSHAPIAPEKNYFYNLLDETHVKSEVKDELTVTDDDIVCAIVNNDDFTSFDGDDYDNDSMLEDITIASLKKIKKKQSKRKTNMKTLRTVPAASTDYPDVIKKGNLRVKDFINMICNICNDEFENWQGLSYHCTMTHGTKPIVHCICGEEIRNQSKIYRHLPSHGAKSKKSDNDGQDINKIKPSSLVNFDCHVCQKHFSSYFSLKSHTQRHHKTTPIVQCSCGVLIKSKTVLYKHVADHNNPNLFFCDKCPKIARSMATLEKHKRRHVPKEDRVFICDSCSKIFNSKDALKSHARSHIPLEERKCYECDVCFSKFTSPSSLRSHKKVVHEKIKAYVCDLCGYSCSTGGELRQHRAIHSDEKPFVCTKCSKPFKTYSNLKTHMDIHEETSYACYLCNRVLNSRRTLRKHLLVHQSECRHVCSFCNRAFKRRQTLKVHLSIHTGDKPMACKWCDERFAYASTLRSHRLRYHPEKMAAQAQSNAYVGYSDGNQAHERNTKSSNDVTLSKMNISYVQSTKDDVNADISKIDISDEAIAR